MRKFVKELVITFDSTGWRQHHILGEFIDSLVITDTETQYLKYKCRNRFEERLVAHNIEIKFKPVANEEFLKDYGPEGFSLLERLKERNINKIVIVLKAEDELGRETKLDYEESYKEIFPVWHENNFDTYENKYQSVERDTEGYITLKITENKENK